VRRALVSIRENHRARAGSEQEARGAAAALDRVNGQLGYFSPGCAQVSGSCIFVAQFIPRLSGHYLILLELTILCSSSACQCPEVSALQRSLDTAATRITELEAAAASRLSELEAAAARLKALESKVSHLWAAAAPPQDPQ
jgi:hypothetical protein